MEEILSRRATCNTSPKDPAIVRLVSARYLRRQQHLTTELHKLLRTYMPETLLHVRDTLKQTYINPYTRTYRRA